MQLGLMFVSALPIALSIISTRPADSAAASATSSVPSRREVARQSFLHTIQFDLLLIIGALFGIAGIEAASRDPVNLWRTLYEVVSAYGTGTNAHSRTRLTVLPSGPLAIARHAELQCYLLRPVEGAADGGDDRRSHARPRPRLHETHPLYVCSHAH